MVFIFRFYFRLPPVPTPLITVDNRDQVPGSSHPDPSKLKGRIEAINVRFAYPSKPNREILKGVSFVVEAGSTVGIMGETGCGKSTFFQLLMRYYDLKEGCGEILLDGHNIKEYNPVWLREQIAMVPQDNLILPRIDIKKNLTCVFEWTMMVFFVFFGGVLPDKYNHNHGFLCVYGIA